MIDTHSHIYAEEFDLDRNEVILRAKTAGIKHIILPNVDSESLPRMLSLETEHPGYCHAAIGVHPTSIKDNYLSELKTIKAELDRRSYVAIGEIGIDLYWDQTHLKEQIHAFQQQIEWALDYHLPVIIHVRDSFRETMDALTPYKGMGLTGVFHSFTGTKAEADEIIHYGGFALGINGIVTFKNSGLANVVKEIGLNHLVMETDAPYLTPSPYRGKRNESAYVQYICQKFAEIFNTDTNDINTKTTRNALNIFKSILNETL